MDEGAFTGYDLTDKNLNRFDWLIDGAKIE